MRFDDRDRLEYWEPTGDLAAVLEELAREQTGRDRPLLTLKIGTHDAFVKLEVLASAHDATRIGHLATFLIPVGDREGLRERIRGLEDYFANFAYRQMLRMTT